MAKLRPEEILKFLDKELKQYSDLAPKYASFKQLYQQKLWHQLTVELTNFVLDPVNRKDGNLVDLYYNFIAGFESHVNPLRFVQICSVIANSYLTSKATEKSFTEALAFMSSIENKSTELKFSISALIVCKMASVELLVKFATLLGANNKEEQQTAQLEKAMETIEHVQNTELFNLAASKNTAENESVALSAFYRSCFEYYKLIGPAQKLYEAGVKFLAYTPLESLEGEIQQKLAIDVCISAIIAENEFNFGEIISQQILKSLEKTEEEWLLKLLKVFHEGDVKEFAQVIEMHQSDVFGNTAKFKILGENIEILRQKMGLLALTKLVFSTDSSARTIPFDSIAEATGLDSEQVEWLLMKAMSKGLIKGQIDGVARTVEISWLKPRVMTISELGNLDQKLETWRVGVEKSLGFITQETPELFA